MSKDTIYREDAITSIKPMVGEFTDNGFMVDYERVLSILEEIPSADRPQGEWIDKAISIIDDMQREGIIDYEQAWEYRMRARMKGADDE